jgi:hypothetical protein
LDSRGRIRVQVLAQEKRTARLVALAGVEMSDGFSVAYSDI